ncbi:diablo IAP-binding mitochondrial protein-like [Branchiostoma floridae x Branchiostoma belcheri]
MMLSFCRLCFRRQQSFTQLKNVICTSTRSVFRGSRGSGICATVGVWTGCTYTLSTLQLARVRAAEPVYPAKLQPPDPSTLTHQYLMKSAAAMTVDSAITLLSQTTMAIIHLEQEYAKIVSTLTSLLEYETLVLGNPAEERVSQLIIQQRVELEDKRRELQNIEVALVAVQRLIESAAEAAYQTGAEAATVAAQERLQLAQNQIELVRTESRQADQKLNQLQTQTIHKVGEMIKEAEESSTETQS